jgi:gas vesicle protein
MLKQKLYRKVATGAAIAGVVGIVAGALSAPRSGDKTRKLWRNTDHELESTLEDRLGLLYQELGELLTSIQGEEAQLDERQRDRFEAYLTVANRSKEKIAEVLKTVNDGHTDDRDLGKSIKEAQKAITHVRTFLLKK